MNYKKYTDEFKEKIVKDYLNGGSPTILNARHEITRGMIQTWARKWNKYGSFPDGRGKAKQGRPKVTKVNTDEMTKDEYIAYLEMELDILKYIAFLKRKKQK